MPNLIDSSYQTTTVGQRFSFKADIDWIQYWIMGDVENIIQSILGVNFNPANSYILSGCNVTSVAGVTTVSAGLIFGVSKAYGGLVARNYLYYHEESSFPDPTGGDVIVLNTNIVPSSFDPTPFSDASTHDVHLGVTLQSSAGVSGSGDIDYLSLKKLVPDWIEPSTGFGTNWTNAGSSSNSFKYKKNPLLGKVDLTGVIVCTGASPSQTVFTLPVGYRPATNIFIPVSRYDVTTNTFSTITVSIGTGGIISIYSSSDLPNELNDYFSLGSISFNTY